ncbi:tetratricopeptide repeat protein [Pararoseomonas indoligenes]|uniref:Tetratricopeptide repeat protein n=1 Tax=Roseomonas indoligenes TaxID=2820811 RepID=A0A940MZW7_9PROT|nr:tetratricopeptide repeat protein [Pararoseomonas indoligenes]MBP0495276.1 tetratricopeptide repeat protein [Pararoseomonas indoligenes]
MNEVRTVFDGGGLRVRVADGNDSDVAVVTFAPWQRQQNIAGEGFGEAFLAANGIDAIHVTCARNDWYQAEAMAAVIPTINAVLGGTGRRRVGYGSSMGGFAALTFSAALGLDSVIALSPQYSVDRRLVSFETRWADDLDTLCWRYPMAAGPGGRAKWNLLYDPFSVDARHVDLIRALRPVTEFRLPFSGHPSGDFLKQTRLLSKMVLTLLRKDADPASFRSAVRCKRRRSATYWRQLARVLAIRQNPAAAMRALTQAVMLAPANLDYQYARGQLAMKLRDYSLAVWSFEAAVAGAPMNARYHYNLARALRAAGKREPALDAVRQAILLDPRDEYSGLVEQLVKAGRKRGPATTS